MNNIFTRTFILFFFLLTSDFLFADNYRFSRDNFENFSNNNSAEYESSVAKQQLLTDVGDNVNLSIAISEPTIDPEINTTSTITISVENEGPDAATSINVDVTIPTGLAFSTSSPQVGTYTDGIPGKWFIPELLSGQSVNLVLTLYVNPTGDYLIIASITEVVEINNGTIHSAQIDLQPMANLGIGIVISDGTPNVGQDITFTITASNIAGLSNATDVLVTAEIPDGYNYLSHTGDGTYLESTGEWQVGNLDKDLSKQLIITVQVNPSGSYTFSGTIKGSQEDINSANNTFLASTTPNPDLVLTGNVNVSTPHVGDNVEISFTASNTGPSDATSVKVNAELPDGYIYETHTPGMTYNSVKWTIGNMAANTIQELVITAKVKPSGTYSFNGTIEGAEDEPTPANNEVTITLTPQKSDLEITMSSSTPPYYVSQTITFAITLENEGPSDATGISINASIPTGYSAITDISSGGVLSGTTINWSNKDLNTGPALLLTFKATINPPQEIADEYKVTAQIAAIDQYDPIATNNSTSHTPTISNTPPVANNDIGSTYEDITLSVDAGNGVLKNDTDIDGDDLSVTEFKVNSTTENAGTALSITQGTINIQSNGSYTFTPALNYNGIVPDITYTITDGDVLATAILKITVNPVNDAPIANNDIGSTYEDITLSVDAGNGVLKNDTDIDGDDLSVTEFKVNSTTRNAGTALSITQGTINIQSNGSYTFTPALNYNGIVPDITYTITDGTVWTTAILKITVNPINDAPVANDDYVYTAEGFGENFNLLANDNDNADGSQGGLDPNTLEITQQPSHGTITFLPNKNINYTPYTGFYGSDEAEYKICDLGHPGSLCSTAKIFISVTRRSPIANDDTAETDEDEAVQIDVLSNDDDTDLDPTTVVIVAKPQNGTATHLGNGMVEYMPKQDYNGTDFFTYTVTDLTDLTSNVARVDISIHPVDDAPVATNGLYSTRENQLLVISIDERVSDPDDNIDWSAISIETPPDNGLVNTSPGVGELSYTPNNNFVGTDEFQFTIKDLSNLTSNVATISIQVSDQAPTAFDDEATTNEDQPVTIAVLDNDTDPQDNLDIASVTISIAAQNGNASPNPDGTVTYTPNTDFFGQDTFHYTVCDVTGYCDEAKVTLTILPVNDAPLAVDDNVTLSEDTPVLMHVMNNDFDVDNTNEELTLSIVTPPQHGSAQLVLEPIGIQYTPNENYFGSDIFVYRITDPNGLWDEASVDLTITGVNDVPLPANDQYGPISAEGATLDVVTNDTDPDNNLDPSSLSIHEAPTHGSATPNADGTVFYQPNEGFFGNDSFIYQICDDEGACAQAQVSLSVIAGNGPPQATNDQYTLLEDQSFQFNPLENDTDPNNNIDASTLSIVQPPENGTLEFMGNDGSLIYTPAPDYYGSDAFTYEICDTGVPVYCDQATVTFTVTPENDAPRPLPDVADSYDMTIVTINVLTNDSEPEGEGMTASLNTASPSAFGEFTLTENGGFTYEAYPGTYCNTDRIYYLVCDPRSACTESYIDIIISPLDTDADGIPDYLEKDLQQLSDAPLSHQTITDLPDTNEDGTPDYLSTDSDGDGIPDAIESGISDACLDMPRDTNGNGIPDYRDLDSDGDGVTDAEEGTGDCDNDGIPNYIDPFDDCADRLDVPSTFSPNGDGVNDYWVIQGVIDFPDSELSIFNRWGSLVYQKAPYDNSWDGRASSNVLGSDELPEGTYFYILKMNGEVKKGSVYIKK